jgi:nucleotide-binding universal stress UspA family protein
MITWLPMLIGAIVIGSVVLWAIFVYIAVRGLKTEMPDARFAAWLNAESTRQPTAMKVLVPIDGSAASVAAVEEVARSTLPPGSTVELLFAIHSRLPILPDFPPWAVTIAAAHGESIRAQTIHAPEVLAAAERYLRSHQPEATVVTKIVEGLPKAEILREAARLGADRIVLGSHGRGQRAVLGSTAAAVATGAPCTVQIARARPAAARSLTESHAA